MPRMPRSIKLLPLARTDLEDIWLYTFNTWSLDQADSYIREITATFEALAGRTKKGRNIDFVRQGYFRLTVGSHAIFYRSGHDDIEVVRILHRRMDVDRHL